ncbi:MAG: glycosyltransferase family 2 protein [Candidatus Omnitrophota bacterium]
MNIWVLIPAYNEAESLKNLLLELSSLKISVLVIDDGSTDKTYEVAKTHATDVVRNNHNLGKGSALLKGINCLLKNPAVTHIVTMDADGQHSPADIEFFIQKAKENCEFVVGNRMDDPKDMPKIRVITNTFMSWFISKLAGQSIPDTQCGFRLIKRDVLEHIEITTHKFEMESEIIIKAARGNFTIESVPIKSIYFKNRPSKINPIIDTIRFIRFAISINKENQISRNV